VTNEGGEARRGRARGLNRVQIIGNLGRDPELRFTQDGTPVANFSVAVNESWRSRGGGEMRERTEWFRVVVWNQLAEIANQYLNRGQQVFIEGRLQTSEWQDRDGNDRTTTELVAREMIMLGRRGEEDDRENAENVSYDERQPVSEQAGDTRPSGNEGDSGDTITADDLPF